MGILWKVDGVAKGPTEVRLRPGKETSLAPPCLNMILWSGRSGDVSMILQAAIEITCHDHSTIAWVGRCYILLRYLVFVFVVRYLFIRWFPCIRHSIIFWRFPHVMEHVPLQWGLLRVNLLHWRKNLRHYCGFRWFPVIRVPGDCVPVVMPLMWHFKTKQ